MKASDLVRSRPLPLFEAYSDKPERLGAAVDTVRGKYGFGAVLTVREKMLDAVYPFERDRGFVLKTAFKKAVDMRRNGASLRQIAGETGVSLSTVCRAIGKV